MCASTKLILHTVCLHKSQTGNVSGRMEVAGITQGLQYLQNQGLVINRLTTDRAKAIITLMKQKFPNIQHFFDMWHFTKGVAAVLRKVVVSLHQQVGHEFF
jgi:ribonuclease HI